MSADVHSTRHAKLAGPATGGYDGGQKMSSQKRKRDKAQEQLRTRMRQRMNAGGGTSSTLLHGKRRSTLLDGKGETSLSAGMRHSTTMEVTPRDLQANNFWRTQQDRYNTLTGLQSGRQPRISANQTVPLQELVDRVLHRREQNFGPGSKVSPLTIRAYKPPVAPYAIQQSSHVKKIVKMKPIQRRDRDDKGPFVLVLQRNGSDETQSQPRGRRRGRSRFNTDSDIPGTGETSMDTNPVLPPVNSNRKAPELKTWRPELDAVHQPSVLPEAEDRSVTNYRLQLQHANKLAEARFEFQHEVPSNQTVEEMTMQTLNPLPPIQSVYPGDVSEGISSDGGGTSDSSDHQRQTTGPSGNTSGAERTASKIEILNLKKAQKEAKRQKQVDAEEFTLLRTRKRFTNKTKQFKSELERARQLSAIQEDRSSLSSARLRQLSGRKATLSSASSSSNSLNSINETNILNSSSMCEHQSDSDASDGESTKDPGRSASEQSNSAFPLAPPTTPSAEDHEEDDNSVIMNVDVMNSSLQDPAPDESDGDRSMESSGTASSESGSSSISSTTSPHTDYAVRNVQSQPLVTEGADITEGMTWVEGEIPFRENSPMLQEPPPEHGR